MRIVFFCSALFCVSMLMASCKTKTKSVDACGDGFADPGEECDGADLKDTTCVSLGFYESGRTLTCLSDCRLDTSACGPRCGDGAVDPTHGEQCDGESLANQTCESLDHHPGTLGCTAGCQFDTTGCGGTCGDGIVATGYEDCDGGLPDGANCATAGFYQGQLRCGADCAFDTTGCSGQCGDGVIDTTFGELCDGVNLGEATCGSLEFYLGALACGADCIFDTTGCSGQCGDGVIDTGFGELCDGPALGDETCQTQGFYTGTLACTPGCGLDTGGCSESCGDGIVQAAHGEDCDSGVGGASCRAVGQFFGTLACDGGCRFDDAQCRVVDVWGTSVEESSAGVVVDSSGGVIHVGATLGSPDSQTNAGAHDAFVRKVSAQGAHEWTRLVGSTGIDGAWGVAVDAGDNLYVCGVTMGTMPTQNSAGGVDAFLAKFASNGALLWVRQWGTSTDDSATGVAVDADGNAFVTGYTSASMNGNTYLGMTDAYLRKFSPIGNAMWTRQFGSSNFDRGFAVTVDTDGSVLVTGMTGGTLSGQTSLGGEDVFLVRYTTSGAITWNRQYGSANGESGRALAVDGAGNVYVAGSTVGTLTGELSAGSGDLILLKINSAGALQWHDQWGSTGYDEAKGVVVTSSGVVAVTGTVAGPVDAQAHAGNDDVFLSLFTTAGVRTLTRLFGTVSNDTAAGLAANAAGDRFLTGTTQGALGGRPNAGDADAFLIFSP